VSEGVTSRRNECAVIPSIDDSARRQHDDRIIEVMKRRERLCDDDAPAASGQRWLRTRGEVKRSVHRLVTLAPGADDDRTDIRIARRRILPDRLSADSARGGEARVCEGVTSMAYEETTPLPYYPPSPRCFLLLRSVPRDPHQPPHLAHTHTHLSSGLDTRERVDTKIIAADTESARQPWRTRRWTSSLCSHRAASRGGGVQRRHHGQRQRRADKQASQAHTSSSSPTQIKMHVCATRRSLCCDKARVHKTTQTNKRARTNALTRKQPRKRASTVTPPESGGVGRVVSLAAPWQTFSFCAKNVIPQTRHRSQEHVVHGEGVAGRSDD
jgi:hypothetical protein